MNDVEPFGLVVCIVAAAILLAVLSHRISQHVRIPAPGIFLVAAAVASDIFPRLGSLPIRIDQRIVTVALIFILFDGGMHIGWRRFRAAAAPVMWLGIAGTAVTAAALAAVSHAVFGFDWRAALLVGAALSPTDPAVVFSIFGRRQITGQSGTILEGESGVNDPVGIALMISLLGVSPGGLHAVAGGVGRFMVQMAVGAAVGVAGGYLSLVLRRRISLPNEALYPLRTLASAGVIYGLATICQGSGYLAVFVAGIVIGDARSPYKREVERFSAALSSLGEIVAFTVLGLTIRLRELPHGGLWTGIALAGLLFVLIRPVFIGLLLLPFRMRWAERVFIMWAGLKGAVPILLATFVLEANVASARRIYDVVFVVVTISVIIQGGSIPAVAKWLRVPMRVVEPEPWSLGVRFQDEPTGVHRYTVAAGSPADGCAISDLQIGDAAWISVIRRRGQLVHVRGHTVLRAGDEILILADPDVELDHLFARRNPIDES